MKTDIQSLRKNQTWCLVDNKKTLACKWIFRVKRNADQTDRKRLAVITSICNLNNTTKKSVPFTEKRRLHLTMMDLRKCGEVKAVA